MSEQDQNAENEQLQITRDMDPISLADAFWISLYEDSESKIDNVK